MSEFGVPYIPYESIDSSGIRTKFPRAHGDDPAFRLSHYRGLKVLRYASLSDGTPGVDVDFLPDAPAPFKYSDFYNYVSYYVPYPNPVISFGSFTSGVDGYSNDNSGSWTFNFDIDWVRNLEPTEANDRGLRPATDPSRDKIKVTWWAFVEDGGSDVRNGVSGTLQTLGTLNWARSGNTSDSTVPTTDPNGLIVLDPRRSGSSTEFKVVMTHGHGDNIDETYQAQPDRDYYIEVEVTKFVASDREIPEGDPSNMVIAGKIKNASQDSYHDVTVYNAIQPRLAYKPQSSVEQLVQIRKFDWDDSFTNPPQYPATVIFGFRQGSPGWKSYYAGSDRMYDGYHPGRERPNSDHNPTDIHNDEIFEWTYFNENLRNPLGSSETFSVDQQPYTSIKQTSFPLEHREDSGISYDFNNDVLFMLTAHDGELEDQSVNQHAITNPIGSDETQTVKLDDSEYYAPRLMRAFGGTDSRSLRTGKVAGTWASWSLTNSYAFIGDPTDFNLGTSHFTIDGKFLFMRLPDIPATPGGIICKRSDRENGWGLFVDYDDKLKFSAKINATDTIEVVSSGRLVSNNWYHFAVTRDSSGIHLFVNGELQQSNTDILTSESISQVTEDGNGRDVHLELGRLYSSYVSDDGVLNSPRSGGGTWEAYIDEIRIVDKAMWASSQTGGGFTVPTSSFSQRSSTALTGGNFVQGTNSLMISGMTDTSYDNYSFRQEIRVTHELYDPSEVLIAAEASPDFYLSVNDVTLAHEIRLDGNPTTVQGGSFTLELDLKYMPAMTVYWEITSDDGVPSTMFTGTTSGTFNVPELKSASWTNVFNKTFTADIDNPAEVIQSFRINFYQGTDNTGRLITGKDGFIIYGPERYEIYAYRKKGASGGWSGWVTNPAINWYATINENEEIQIKYYAYNVISPEQFRYFGGENPEPDGDNVEFILTEYKPNGYTSTGNTSTTTQKGGLFNVNLYEPTIMRNGSVWNPDSGTTPTDLRTAVVIKLKALDDSQQGGIFNFREQYVLELINWPEFSLNVVDYYEPGFYVNESGHTLEDSYSRLYKNYVGNPNYWTTDVGDGASTNAVSDNFIKFNEPEGDKAKKYKFWHDTSNSGYGYFAEIPDVSIEWKWEFKNDYGNWQSIMPWVTTSQYTGGWIQGKLRFFFDQIKIDPGIEDKWVYGIGNMSWGREFRCRYRFRTTYTQGGWHYAWSNHHGGHWRRLYPNSNSDTQPDTWQMEGQFDNWSVKITENYVVVEDGLRTDIRYARSPSKAGTGTADPDVNCRASTMDELSNAGIDPGDASLENVSWGETSGYDMSLRWGIGFAQVGTILKVEVSDPEGYTTRDDTYFSGSYRPPFGPQPPNAGFNPPAIVKYVTVTSTAGVNDDNPFMTIGGVNMGRWTHPSFYNLYNNKRTATSGYGNRLHAKVTVMTGDYAGQVASDYRWTATNPRHQEVNISRGDVVGHGDTQYRDENKNLPFSFGAGAKFMYGAKDSRGDVVSTDVWWYSSENMPEGILQVNYGNPPGYWYASGKKWYWTKTTWTYYPAYTKTPIYVTSDGYFDGTLSGANEWYPRENHEHFEDVSFEVNVTDNRNYHYDHYRPMPLASKSIPCVLRNTTPKPIGQFVWTGGNNVLESAGTHTVGASFAIVQDEYQKANGQIVPASSTPAPGGTPVRVFWRGPNDPTKATTSPAGLGFTVVNQSTGRSIPNSEDGTGGVMDTFNSDGTLGPFLCTWTGNDDPLPAGKKNYLAVIGGVVEKDAISSGKPYAKVRAGTYFVIKDDIKAPLTVEVNSPDQGIEYGSWAPGGGNFAVTAEAIATGGTPSDDGYEYTWDITSTTGHVYAEARDAPNQLLVRNNREGKGGSVSYTVTVKDSLGATASASGTASITIIGAPTISVSVGSSGNQHATAIAPVVGGMAGGVSWSASVSDADGPVTYSWTGQLLGTASGITTGTYSGQGTANYGVSVNVPAAIRISGGTGGGTWSATCTVTDGAGNTDSASASGSWTYEIEDPFEDDTPGTPATQCQPGWYYVPMLGTCVPTVPPGDGETDTEGGSSGDDGTVGDTDDGGSDTSPPPDIGPESCMIDEVWNPIANRCEPVKGPDNPNPGVIPGIGPGVDPF